MNKLKSWLVGRLGKQRGRLGGELAGKREFRFTDGELRRGDLPAETDIDTFVAVAQERQQRSPLIWLRFFFELPFDVGITEGAFNSIELAHPELDDWADFDLQSFLGMPPLPEPRVRPCVVLRLRRVSKTVESPFANVLRAFGPELASALPAASDLEPMPAAVTVVMAERVVPSPAGEFGEPWLRAQFQIVLSKLNDQLLALGAAAGDHNIRPVTEFELPPVIPGFEQDLRDLADRSKHPRFFFLLLHPITQALVEHDSEVINQALAIAGRGSDKPFFSTMEFLYAARRSLEAGRLAHAVLEAGTAVELLVNAVVRGVGMAKGWSAQKLENVLQDTTPFRNRFSDHFGRALGVVVDRDATGDDPANTWLRTAYPLRNKVAHNGYRPTTEEAVHAVVLAFGLMGFAANRAEEDAGFGITFPEISELLPVPGLDERSLAQGDASERRLAQESFDAALEALEKADEHAAQEAFHVAYEHGSSKAAFNLGIIAWRAGQPEQAITWLRRAADQDHGGACAYLGVLLLGRDELAEAEDLFNRASISGHPRGRPLGTFFEAALLTDRGDLQQAAHLYRDAAVVSDFSLGPEAAFRRGALLQELNDPAAIDAFQFGLELGSARAALALADHFRVLQSADEAVAMLRRALSLDADHGSEAVDIGHHIIITLYDPHEDSVRAAVARGFVMTGALLDEQQRGDDAVDLYDEVVTVFRNSAEPVLREAVARAMVSKSASLGRRGRHSDAVTASDVVIARLGDDAELSVREQVATAYTNKAFGFVSQGSTADAVATCDEFIARFADAPEPSLRDRVEAARQLRTQLVQASGT